jgi:hypothetical protein
LNPVAAKFWKGEGGTGSDALDRINADNAAIKDIMTGNDAEARTNKLEQFAKGFGAYTTGPDANVLTLPAEGKLQDVIMDVLKDPAIKGLGNFTLGKDTAGNTTLIFNTVNNSVGTQARPPLAGANTPPNTPRQVPTSDTAAPQTTTTSGTVSK